MKFPQFDHLSEEEAKLHKAIAAIIAEHLDASEGGAAGLAEGLISHGLLNTYQVFEQARDIAAMKRVRAALIEVSRAMSEVSMGKRAQDTIHQAIVFGPFFEKMMAENGSFSKDEFETFLNKTGQPDLAALTRIECAADRFRNAFDLAIRHVKQSPYTRQSATRINTQAVGIVSASAFIWQLAGKTPPKALNDSSPFANFLADIFEALEIDAAPRSAFNAWTRERKKVHTSLEKTEGSMHD
jgi:hypothetical protein